MITDQRVKLMQEVVQGIRVIKYYGWEGSFEERIVGLRTAELHRIQRAQYIRAAIFSTIMIVPILACTGTLLSYSLLGNAMTPSIIFPALAYFQLLRLPLILLPNVIGMVTDARVALKRLQEFLTGEEIRYHPQLTEEAGIRIKGDYCFEQRKSPSKESASKKKHENGSQDNLVDHGESASQLSQKRTALSLDLTIKRGSLTAIIGPVGSGKSTLLSALVGELKPQDPDQHNIAFCGPVGYASQQAWLQNATIRENILFGSDWDEEWYERVLDAAALHPDLAILPQGDQTEVGERGVSLSGGQKQRISLARLMYSRAEVLLIDDPLSAVDAQVGRHIFQRGIRGLLGGKTRLLVTHQLHFLPQADWIIVMERGENEPEAALCRIAAQGTYQQLVEQNEGFRSLMGQFGLTRADENENTPRESTNSSMATPVNPSKNGNSNGGGAAAEDRAIGSVSWAVYREYVSFAGGWRFIMSAVVGMLVVNGVRVATDFWLSWWTQQAAGGGGGGLGPQGWLLQLPHLSTAWYAGVYAGLGILQGGMAFAQALLFAWCCTEAARRLHAQALHALLAAPIASFFDLHSTGRVINRFSKDLDVVDNLLTESLRSCLSMLGSTVTTLLVIALSSWWFLLPLLPLLLIYHLAQSFYRRSSRELKRLDALSRSPMVSLLTDTLVGMSTLRAYHRQPHFAQRMTTLLNLNGRPALLQLMAQRWMAIRLESIGNLIILAASLACLLAPIPASLVGLAVGYSLSITGMMHWLVRQVTDSETQIISSERLSHYAHGLPQEGGSHGLAIEPAEAGWPSRGEIAFKGVSLRYRPELPLVLHSLTLHIPPGQRVGIVGRTGAGKSSLLVALFR